LRGAVIGKSRDVAIPGAAATTYGMALTTRMAVASIALSFAEAAVRSTPNVRSHWMCGSPSMIKR
jgi:hypothetical protein